MLVTLTPAIIGLVGVLVGALISTGANYWLAVRKENTEAAKEKYDRDAALKTAARLIANEFFGARAAANIAVDKRRWPEEMVKFPLDGWRSGRAIIARELPYADWSAVETAALAVEHFDSFRAVPRASENLADSTAETVKPIVRDITAGLEALRPYIVDSPAPKLNRQ